MFKFFFILTQSAEAQTQVAVRDLFDEIKRMQSDYNIAPAIKVVEKLIQKKFKYMLCLLTIDEAYLSSWFLLGTIVIKNPGSVFSSSPLCHGG